MIEYAKSRLAPYKAPKTVEFVDAIPRTAATKVNRSAMIAARGGWERARLSDRSGIFECMFDTLSQSAALTFWGWHDKQLPDGTVI